MGACGGKIKPKHMHSLSNEVSDKDVYKGGWRCDKCASIHENKEMRWHCQIDNFDCCDTCYKKV